MNLISLPLDNTTGLPPERQALDEERARLENVKRLAEEADGLLRDATEKTRFACSCDLPARVVRSADRSLLEVQSILEYEALAQRVRKYVDADHWAQAAEELRDFLAGKEDDDSCADRLALRLLTALEIGREAHEIRTTSPDERTECVHLRRLEQERGFSHPLLLCHAQYLQQLETRLIAPELRRLGRMVSAAERLGWRPAPSDPVTSMGELLTRPLVEDAAALEQLEALLKERELRKLAEASLGPLERPTKPPAPSLLRKWTKRLEKTAGANRVALLAAMGDAALVLKEYQALGPPVETVLLHNLAVAVLNGLKHRETEPAGRDDNGLRVAIGVCALLAADPAYRGSLMERFGTQLVGKVPEKDQTVRAQVRDELKSLLESAGIPWGRPGDPDSWACRWESESYATLKVLALRPSARSAVAFGPSLVQFFGLEEQLARLIQDHADLRRWFGPCAQGLTVSFRDEFDSALAYFERIARGAQALARGEPGYAMVSDPAGALEQDALQSRCEGRLRMLGRCGLSPDVSDEDVASVKASLYESCADVLDTLERLEQGPALAVTLANTLKRVFESMEQQLDHPDVNLGRPASVADSRIRYECVDGAVALVGERIGRLEGRIRRSGSQDVLRDLVANLRGCLTLWRQKRSDVAVSCIWLRSRQWGNLAEAQSASHEELLRMLEDMERLAEQAVQDHRRSPHANLAQVEIQMLKSHFQGELVTQAERFRERLNKLKELAVAFGWPDRAHARASELTSMLEMAKSLSSHLQWLRQMRSERTK